MLPGENTQLVATEGACVADTPKILCIIRDTTNPQWQTCNITINLPATCVCRELCDEVAKQANYEPGSFELYWLKHGQDSQEEILINEQVDLTLFGIGMMINNKKNHLQIRDKDGQQPVPIPSAETMQETGSSELSSTVGGASAATTDFSSSYNTSPPEYPYTPYSSVLKPDTGFVGLVNQAMTCYLNSLLQTLYMTPEFRNALYRWEFDGNDSGEMTKSIPYQEASKSIPYQLQRLFVQMQTSEKKSVETTDVTKSFGWDSTEAWQQHDVQELCRVMFDALETKFKHTEQADLINQLYQGKMKDYVKCLECGYESARTDAFLDIPLTIRPFGSTQSYGSLTRALEAFVQPETLEGSNQYFCEKCNKKCDAHKGLKFLKFPYLLTLQLKRFDFDYSTMHRIKLNDQMTFPAILDLSPFTTDDGDIQKKSDPESNTDSGAENEDSCHSNNSSDCLEDGVDEGIDIEQTANAECSQPEEDGWTYELFSIMVHSGSAAGGHYYAYIKSFKDQQWYCFNDQHVSTITQDDIRKTYGGSLGSHKGYYLSAYSSSTNAYMLMYRRVLPEKNKSFMEETDFPPHIVQLVKQLKQQEELERRQKEIDRNTCKIKLFGFHPVKNKMLERRLDVHKDKTLKEATELAYMLLDLDDVLPLELCRLVKYDEFHDSLEKSYEGDEETSIGTILGGVKSSYSFDLLMETRRPEQTFQVYKPGGVTVKVYEVDVAADIMHPPITVRAYLSQTVGDFKQLLAEVTGKGNKNTMRVVLERYYNDLRLLTVANKSLKAEGFFRSNKVFIECHDEEDASLPFWDSRLFELIDRYAHTIRVYISLPTPLPVQLPAYGDITETRSDTRTLENKFRDTHVSDETSQNSASGSVCVQGGPDTSRDNVGQGDHSSNLHNSGQGVVVAQESCQGQRDIPETECWDRPVRNCESDCAASVDKTDCDAGVAEVRDTAQEGCRNDGTDNAPQVGASAQTLDNTADINTADINACQRAASTATKDTKHGRDVSTTTDTNGTVDSSLTTDQTTDSSPAESKTQEVTEDSTRENSEPSNTCTQCDKQQNSEETSDNKLELESNSEMKHKQNPKTKKKWYIHIERYKEDEEETMLLANVDKRITLGAIKKSLEPYIGATSQNFKVYRVYPNNQEFECIRLNENLSSFGDDSKISVRLGRALKKGEYRVKIYQLLINDSEPCKFLFEWIFAKGMSVLQSKLELLEELNKTHDMTVPLERFRLRKKTWKNPGTIFLDEQIYEDDIPVFPNWEVFVQVLDEPDKMKSMSDLSLFVKRWRPSELKLDPFQEVTLVSNASVEELKKKISALSGLAIEDIEFAKGRGTFPCEVSVLDIQTDLEWDPQVATLNVCPLYICDDGQVIYYRDRNEEMKEMTDEERKDIQKKENARWVNSNQRITFSPKKERALKIYTDSSPPLKQLTPET